MANGNIDQDMYYLSALRDYLKSQWGQGNPISYNDAQQSEEFQQILEDLNTTITNPKTGKQEYDNSPTGKRAQALVALGRRKPEWDWNVGDTPKE